MDVTPQVAQELEMMKRGVALVEVKPDRGAAADRRSQAGCRRGCSDAAASSTGNEDDPIAGLREAMTVELSDQFQLQCYGVLNTSARN